MNEWVFNEWMNRWILIPDLVNRNVRVLWKFNETMVIRDNFQKQVKSWLSYKWTQVKDFSCLTHQFEREFVRCHNWSKGESKEHIFVDQEYWNKWASRGKTVFFHSWPGESIVPLTEFTRIWTRIVLHCC